MGVIKVSEVKLITALSVEGSAANLLYRARGAGAGVTYPASVKNFITKAGMCAKAGSVDVGVEVSAGVTVFGTAFLAIKLLGLDRLDRLLALMVGPGTLSAGLEGPVIEGNIEVEFRSGVESDDCSDLIDKSAYGRREPAFSNNWACARVGSIEFGV